MFDTICHEHLEYYSSTVLNNMLKKIIYVYLILKLIQLMVGVNNILYVKKKQNLNQITKKLILF